MTLDNFIIYNIIMITFSWFLYYRHGETSYDNGFMDAVQLHSEGRLKYTIETGGVIMIEVTDED
tara:strand:+ start:825 stop:1016 length:192 start_codon:yes stop_codon:yes gene_type:complete